MDIIQAMQERRSVRNFDGKPLSQEQKDTLLNFASEAYNPFGGNNTLRLKAFDLAAGYKPATYGSIKGANDFFLLAFDIDDPMALLSAGFCFEQVVLKAWQMGLGTCWIAGTYKKTKFDDGQTWPDGQALHVVCPVGVAAKKGLLEKVTRFALGSQNRKPFAELFFLNDFSTPLPEENRFAQALKMLRIAPSSTNSQPWRALVVDQTVHFYCKPKNPISRLDVGIGICHFWETLTSTHTPGYFFQAPDAPAAPLDLQYVTSYRME